MVILEVSGKLDDNFPKSVETPSCYAKVIHPSDTSFFTKGEAETININKFLSKPNS